MSSFFEEDFSESDLCPCQEKLQLQEWMVKKGSKKEIGEKTTIFYQSGRSEEVELLLSGKTDDLFMHAAVTKNPLTFNVNQDVPIERLQP